MKILDNYNDFLLENVVYQLPFRLSDRLKQLLVTISHPIAISLLQLGDTREEHDLTLLDYDTEDNGKFKYVLSNKAYDVVKDRADATSYSSPQHYLRVITNLETLSNKINNIFVTTSIGKAVNKIFPKQFQASGKPGEDIESFANMIKHKRSQKFEKFKIVDGEDIIKYYDEKNYDSNAPRSPLGSSCMRYDGCDTYINFYAMNKGVKLVVLFSDDEDDKIIGRALLWDIAEFDGEKVGMETKFMDRIYTVYDFDVMNFKEYAEKNGWLYKIRQDMDQDTKIFDPRTGESKSMMLKTVNGFEKNTYSEYPYMDTMKWFFFEEGFIANRDSAGGDMARYIFMESTSGEGEEGTYGGIYVDYYGKSFRPNEVVWCDFGEEYRTHEDAIKLDSRTYATEDYVNDNMVYSEIQGKYIDSEDAEQLEYYDDYVSPDYLRNNFVWSEYDHTYYKDDDCVFSQYHDTYILGDDSIEVYLDLDKKKTDYRCDGDDSYITVEVDGGFEYYDMDNLQDEFIHVIVEMKPYLKYKWDWEYNKDKYVKVKGKYYHKKFEDELTGLKN